MAGFKNADDPNDQGLTCSFSAQGGNHSVGWRIREPVDAGKEAADPKPPSSKTVATGAYLLKAAVERNLTWPEWVRKRVESDVAAQPDLSQKWLVLRLLLSDNSYKVYLDDRMLWQSTLPKGDLSGTIRLNLSPEVELAAVQTRELMPPFACFEPVPLDNYLNAHEISGKIISRASLPEPGKNVEIDGIPFLFPAQDAKGNDHLSLVPSWLQVGCLLGGFYPDSQTDRQRGEARWVGACALNPARIQFRVPYARYARLHLIAAADGEKDHLPIITAQFYRPSAGFSHSFATNAPLFSIRSKESTALPVKLESRGEGYLYHVTLELDPGKLAMFEDKEFLEMELTKEIKLYRCYPDPHYYAEHQAGLPSGVRVFAMTLEKPAVNFSLEPDKFGHSWTAPTKPGYTVKLQNRTDETRKVDLIVTTRSLDGEDKSEQQKNVAVPPGNKGAIVKFGFNPKRYGHHDIVLTIKDGNDTWNEQRSFAYLHEDTRERGEWVEGKGPLFGGYIGPGGGHYTPVGLESVEMMAAAGAESGRGLESSTLSQDTRALMEKWGMITYMMFDGMVIYATGNTNVEAVLKWCREHIIPETKTSRQEEVPFFPEPGIGSFTDTFPEYFGEPAPQMTKEEQARYENYLSKFITNAKAIRKEWPKAKFLLPHGDCLFCVPFLRYSPEARDLIDGVALDFAQFERIPEQQLHQCALHRMWFFQEEWKKAGKKSKPILSLHEGCCLAPVMPAALTEHEQAVREIREFLILSAYGVTRLLGFPGAIAPGDYWGTQHYGAGHANPIPLLHPYEMYSCYATVTRHLNRMNFEQWLPTSSLSTYCLQFKHYKTGKLLHVFWTIFGKRPVVIKVPDGEKLEVFDSMDNQMKLSTQDGFTVFTISDAPCFAWGLSSNAQFTLGEPNHSDAQPAEITAHLGNLGDDSWRLSNDEDLDYAESHFTHIRRYPGRMSAQSLTAPAAQGAKALALHLEKQDTERRVMPFYTTIVPKRPIEIPGKASHIGLWVKAASDWGRVVYALRDAKGERWISVGKKGTWNTDDNRCWSVFCFDGWRYLRFEMPANSPYDCYRESGTTWWGYYGEGDGIVDLPLKLEKIIVERRTHAIYVNDPQPTSPDDVLFGDLFAEYQSQQDQTDEAVRISRLRMPIPKDIPELDNPIKAMEASGEAPATIIRNVLPPAQQYDGTRCHIQFDEIPNAKTYNVWVSPYPDGRGAILLGKAWKNSGGLIQGLRPEMDFYAFVVYIDQDGRQSKPSAGFKFLLKDMFAMK